MIAKAIRWLVLCTIPCWQLAFAAEKLHIYTESFSPYNFIRGDEIVGINIELVKQACENAEVECTFELLSWSRAYKFALQTPQTGLVSTARMPKRERLFHWVGPLLSGQACLYKLKDREEIPALSRQSLKNYTIGLLRNDVFLSVFSSWGLVENDDYLIYADRYEDVKAFKAGKLDLIVASSYNLAHYLAPGGLSVDVVEPVFVVKDPAIAGNYLALNLAVSPEIVKALQFGLAQVSQRQINQLVESYVPSSKKRKNWQGPLKACF